MDPAQLRFEELGKLRALKRATKVGLTEGTLVGICQDMCPEYERLERQLHLDLTRPFETLPNDPTTVDPHRAVKKYHRPAAGNEAPLPEDVRPPAILLKTLDHLLSLHVLLRTDVPFLETQKFLRDRMRSLRQDLTLQSIKSHEAVHINQCIARFHIYCGVVLREAPKAEFDPFQNLEQLRKVLQTLFELYEDGHKHERISRTPIMFENEAEFRAYRILAHLDDPNEAYEDSAPPQVQNHAQFRNALELANAFHTGNFFMFQKILKNESFLFRALAFQWHISLQERMRAVEEKAMEKMMELVFLVDGTVPTFEGSLDVLIKSGCVDEAPLRLKSEFKSLIYHQLLSSIVKDSINQVAQEAYLQKKKELQVKVDFERKRMEEQKAQELKEFNRKKHNIVTDLAETVLVDGISRVITQVATDEIKRYQSDRCSEAKHALNRVIYDSCLNVCVPFYLKMTLFEALAERKHEYKIRKRIFKRMKSLKSRKRQNPKVADELFHDISHKKTSIHESSIFEKLIGRANNFPCEHPLYKKYKAACIQISSNSALTDEQKVLEVERQYPSFMFTPSSTLTLAASSTKISEEAAKNGVARSELEELKRMLALEEEHTQKMEIRLKELIKSDY